jgi:hypothetical protein
VPYGFDGEARVYHERFISGSCDDAGTWRVRKVSDDELSASWSASGDAYTITATLTHVN